jgi:hypothetical protein
MRFSLRRLFLITTNVAILAAGVAIGRTHPPALVVMAVMALMIWHIDTWKDDRLQPK